MSTASSSSSRTETVHRSCPLCEAHCGIAVEVERPSPGSRGGRVRSIRGDERDPHSRGYLCPKAYGLKGLHEDPDRLRAPLVKRDGAFQEAGWDEALDLVAERLRAIRDQHGADAIATYIGNPTAHDFGTSVYIPAFLRALGTRWRFSASSVDQLPKMLTSCLMFGAPLAIPVPDLDHTDHLVVLGANPLASNGSLMTAPDVPRRLRALRERGGRLVVIDPRRSETARVADEHVFLRPGSDAFLLFGLVHVLFAEDLVAPGPLASCLQGLDEVRALAADFAPEAVAPRCGVPAETIRRLARELAAAPSAAVYGRIGTCTQEFGTLASWLVDVLNVLTGNLDRPGGALFPRAAHSPPVEGSGKKGRVPYARWRSHVRGLPEFNGELPVAALAEEMDAAGEGRIRALVTVAGNPVLSTPNGARLAKALEGLDFMVSVDLYRNETTRYADVVLPTTTPLERSNYDFVFHQLAVRNGAKFSPAVFEPEGDLRQPWQVLGELAGRVNGVARPVVDDLVLSALLGPAVGPGTPCPELTVEEARQQLDRYEGPERLLDLMLRTGPYGDRFDDGAEGLSLAKLAAQQHGCDLGPLAPRLPGMLTTASGAVELAPERIVGDVARLRAGLSAPAPGLVLVGRRHLRSNNSWMHNLRALAKGKERCVLTVHPQDAARLGLEDGKPARVSSRVGEVVAPVALDDGMMPGVVSLPHGYGHGEPGVELRVAREAQPGVNSNRLTDETLLDEPSGNAVLNGIPVEVSAA